MVVHSWTDSLPRDNVVNVLHFQTNAPLGQADLDDLASDVTGASTSTSPFPTRTITTKIYDLEDEKPRPVKATFKTTAGGAMSGTGNRDVALCLSFSSGRNLPRQRGRLYLVPFSAADAGSNRPP